MQVKPPRAGVRRDDLLPLSSNGRALGRAVEWVGRRIEGAGLGLQTIGSELRFRRWRAMHR